MNWLKRSGIKKDAPDAGQGQPGEETAGDVEQQGGEAAPDVDNSKATPVIDSERGIPSVNHRSYRSKAVPVSIAAVLLVLMGIVWLIPGPKTPAPLANDDPKASKDVRFDENRPTAVLMPKSPPTPPAPAPAQVAQVPAPTHPPPPPIQVVPAPARTAAPGPAPAQGSKPLTPLELRQQSKTLIVGKAATPAEASEAEGAQLKQDAAVPAQGAVVPNGSFQQTSSTGEGGGGAPGGNQLGNALRPTVLNGTFASKLADRTFMMPQGTMIDCSLDVAISSSVAGMVKCTLTRDVYGDDRKVVLLNRGTELTGQYQGGMQQGQSRLFILWARARTPQGVTIALNSPGTDSLGRGGVDGYIDTHFWERFGAALFLSIVDDGLAIIAAQAQDRSGDGNNTVVLPQNTQNSAKNAATVAVENSIRIPPTLIKNQGEHIAVFLARDLDFRTVYELQPAFRRQ